ncbi:hypothetical protein CC78DRAFT_535299 [Lojkania enalia]|uniref:Uncharacterized protein n=1 Tax=Lojkania enalia TaxID=147567 RepID=A0A9P4N7E4_9PLEO|nr:hypothetical protein CC78DRAFT_535299 [Didymosphaeria enalia]
MPKTLRPAFGELGYPKAPFTASAPNRPAHSRLPRIAEAPKLSEQASISPIPNTPRRNQHIDLRNGQAD